MTFVTQHRIKNFTELICYYKNFLILHPVSTTKIILVWIWALNIYINSRQINNSSTLSISCYHMAMRILLSLTAIFISIIAIGQPVNLPKDSTTISAVPRINPDQWEAEHTTAYPGEPEQFLSGPTQSWPENQRLRPLDMLPLHPHVQRQSHYPWVDSGENSN